MKKIIPFLILISSCALMNEKECQTANWTGLGEQDAMKGKTTQYFYKREEACAEHGVKADQRRYHYGYKQGIKSFCTYDNGVSWGEEDNSYKDTCSGDGARQFLRGYELGQKNLEIRKLREEVERLQSLREQHFNGGLECITKFNCEDHNKCVDDHCSITGESCFSDFSCNSNTECIDSRCVY